MRVGDFGLEVLPASGEVRETNSGHVLARPGQVYRLRLRNFGPLRCVVHVEMDGRGVTGGGLVLDPFTRTDLERPVTGETGRFTVIAEGDESVFGPDGGRDNPALGLIQATFRRELPRALADREWPSFVLRRHDDAHPGSPRTVRSSPPRISAFRSIEPRPGSGLPELAMDEVRADIERAAGTGLTGSSNQRFEPIVVGRLEDEPTVLKLRLVIGSFEAIAAGELTGAPAHDDPERPAARP